MLNAVLVLAYAVLVLAGTNRTVVMEAIMDTSVVVVVVTHVLAWAAHAFPGVVKQQPGPLWLVAATVVAAVVPCVGIVLAASSWYVSLATGADVVVAGMLALSDYVVSDPRGDSNFLGAKKRLAISEQ